MSPLALPVVATLLAAGLPLAGPRAAAQVYRVKLTAQARDAFLPAPERADVVFKVDARRAPPKARIMFLQPLPAGAHRLRLDVAGGRAGDDPRTLVVAVPLGRGRSTVQVDVAGPGRYDFGFWSGDAGAPVKEYRFTLAGPRASRTFDLDLP